MIISLSLEIDQIAMTSAAAKGEKAPMNVVIVSTLDLCLQTNHDIDTSCPRSVAD